VVTAGTPRGNEGRGEERMRWASAAAAVRQGSIGDLRARVSRNENCVESCQIHYIRAGWPLNGYERGPADFSTALRSCTPAQRITPCVVDPPW
jgi:hypothetical protein